MEARGCPGCEAVRRAKEKVLSDFIAKHGNDKGKQRFNMLAAMMQLLPSTTATRDGEYLQEKGFLLTETVDTLSDKEFALTAAKHPREALMEILDL